MDHPDALPEERASLDASDATLDTEARTRRALLHMLEDLDRERQTLSLARRQWIDTVDSVSDPMMVHDDQFRVVRANRAYAERAGMPFKDIVGRLYWECFPKRAGPLPKCRANMAERAEAESQAEEEFVLEGEVFVSRVFSMRDAERGTLLSLHFFEDITERRRAAEALRENVERLERIFETTHFGIAYLDRDFNFIRANRAYAETCGHPPEYFPGNNHFDLYPHAENEAIFRRVVTTGKPSTVLAKPFEFPDQPERGTTYWDWTLHPLRDAGGTVEALLFVVLDVTARKRSEQALRRVNLALRTLSACNESLVRADNEPGLLQDMCRVIVEVGGYGFAMVGYAMHDAQKSIELRARSGKGDPVLIEPHLSWADDERGTGPMGSAIREGVRQTLGRLAAERQAIAPSELASKLGLDSIVAFPLRMGTGEVIGALCIGAVERGAFDADELTLLEELAADLAYGIVTLRARLEARENAVRLRESLEETVFAIATTVEMRDPYTAGHQRRVTELAIAIARKLGLSDHQLHGLRLASMVHDLGKIRVPAEILSKPGRLTDIEMSLMKLHPKTGNDILKDIKFPWPIARIVLEHHERIDGSGYPHALKGDSILLESRILGVADVVEAMASHRPYRPGLGIEAALAEIGKGSGRLYDPSVADACTKLFRESGFSFA
ncbi:MAG: PAS domain-containing protein [Betaproteobacteria bacterium]|nr:PAS domain-containing protein [Betaproteobacteria bacterium]